MFSIANDARFWDRAARKYAADPISDVQGYERTLERTRHYLKSEDTVLEVGCGTGTTALRLAPSVAHIVGTDISGKMIAIAREKAETEGVANAAFEVGTPDAARWQDSSFDVVLGFNLLHLVSARATAIAGIHRLLTPGGHFISKTPCLREMNPVFRVVLPAMQMVGKAPYVSFLSVEDLEREMREAGFEIVERGRHASRGKDARPFLVARRR